MEIVLRSNDQRVISIIKPTKAKFFADIEVGDRLHFYLTMSRPGRNRGVTYAQYLTVLNLSNGRRSTESMTSLTNRLQSFELEEIDE
jgi:hypothetical protein